jgi:hypothetical protein
MQRTRGWALQCAALCVPFAAVLHHAVFFRPTCMLNPFGPDYTPSVLAKWITHDPSLPVALLLAALVFVAGLRLSLARRWVPAFLIAFAPLSLWIWDVPLAGRPICGCCHDGRLVLPGIGHVSSRHVYAFCLGLFAALLIGRWLATIASRAAARRSGSRTS